jgi:hypothetical protein
MKRGGRRLWLPRDLTDSGEIEYRGSNAAVRFARTPMQVFAENQQSPKNSEFK